MTGKKNLNKEIHSESIGNIKNPNKAWDKDNQAWWDWYVTLADNSSSNTKNALLELPEPQQLKDFSTIERGIN